ncbi:hypothetical protein SAMN05216487_3448 [Pseudomonas sp. UC 17F4]|uniref:hypothetical protein n=1 Tax=Pseudomonas sp. UC 17F4 TaxID=1855328 RepID=UPI000882752F|nr:hypothetical protein [Pseudomonas sp. UC 17F4]SDQ71333.1 hypothetical protein SAMN05216487_3448 [Pseudomonas sp. UC 17F4]
MFISLKNLTFMALLWALMLDAHALTITPTETRYEAAGNRYYFTVTDWSTSDTSRSFCINPLNPEADNGCILEAGLVTEPGSPYFIATQKIATLPNSRTMGQALQDLMKQGFSVPLRVSVLVPRSKDIPPGACLTLIAFYPGVGGIPGFGPCVAPVAPVVQCDLTGNNRIDYGWLNLYQDTVEGAKASTWVDIICTGPTTVRVKAGYPDSSGIPVGKGVKATLDIDGQDIGVVGNSTQGGYDLVLEGPDKWWWSESKIIESTLHTGGKTPETGEMSGSTWIEIYIP